MLREREQEEFRRWSRYCPSEMWNYVKLASRQGPEALKRASYTYPELLQFHNQEDDEGAKNFRLNTGRSPPSPLPPTPLPTDMCDSAGVIAEKLGKVFADADIPYAIGGALSLGVWGPPRTTIDVDINIFLEPEQVDRVLKVCNSLPGFTGLPDEETAKQIFNNADLIRGYLDSVKVELFFNVVPLNEEAAKRKQYVSGFWSHSAEVIVVFKLLYGRSKDLIDIEKLVSFRLLKNKPLDVDWILATATDLLGPDAYSIKEFKLLLATLYEERQGPNE